MTPFTISLIVFAAVIFICLTVFLFVTAGREGDEQLRDRLDQVAAEGASAIPEGLRQEVSPFDRLLRKIPVLRRIELLLEQSDFKVKPGQFVLITVLLFLVGVIGGYLLADYIGRIHAQKPFLAGLLGLILGGAPYLIAVDRRKHRIRRFTEQFPDALSMISRSLRAGHGFSVAMQLVGTEMPDPISQFFRRASEEQRFGLGLDEVLENLTRRMPTLDVQFFASAVIIQRETGGNLAEVMDKLGQVIRERFRIMGEIRVYTAQGRLTGMLLAGLPLILGVVMFLLRPEYIMVLFKEQVGLMMVAAAVALQVVGFFVIRRIVHINI